MKLKQLDYFMLLLTCLFLTLMLPSILSVQSPTEKQVTMEHNDQVAKSATVYSIFANNIVITLGTLIPVFGWGYILYIMWNTGTVIASYSQPFYWVLNNPFAWIELSVCSYAILQSIKLLKFTRQRNWNKLVRTICVSTGIIATAVLASAAIEILVISR